MRIFCVYFFIIIVGVFVISFSYVRIYIRSDFLFIYRYWGSLLNGLGGVWAYAFILRSGYIRIGLFSYEIGRGYSDSYRRGTVWLCY